LSGGITNLNFKIEADGKAYVIRLAGEIPINWASNVMSSMPRTKRWRTGHRT
jgi:hypothetical protein